MVDRSYDKFLYSNLFETVEETKRNPFEFKTHQEAIDAGVYPCDNPQDLPDITFQGNLLRRIVSEHAHHQSPFYLLTLLLYTQQLVNAAESENHPQENIADQAEQGETEKPAGQSENSSAAPEEGKSDVQFDNDYYVLRGNILQRFANEEEDTLTGVICIRNCRVKKHYFKDTESKYMYGFIMMAKGKSIDFYVDSLQLREDWINAIKKHVILIDLKNEFTIHQLLGRGNFAKVHSCTRKTNDQTQYALKTMQKSALTKTKRNIVSNNL